LNVADRTAGQWGRPANTPAWGGGPYRVEPYRGRCHLLRRGEAGSRRRRWWRGLAEWPQAWDDPAPRRVGLWPTGRHTTIEKAPKSRIW